MYLTYVDNAAYNMTKRDNEKDSERPHYYSQFWLDVAAGRRIIGTPKLSEDGEQTEAELLDAVSYRPVGYRSSEQENHIISSVATNGRRENGVQPEIESEIEVSSDEEYTEPEEDPDLVFADTEAAIDDQDLIVEDTDIPDMDLGPIEEEYSEEEDEAEVSNEIDEVEEEDEEENWGRGRKKSKPLRPVKAPAKKPTKRDPRRGGY